MTPESLKARRLALGLSVTEMAGLLGVARSTIYLWEKGQIRISTPGVLDLAIRHLEEMHLAAEAEDQLSARIANLIQRKWSSRGSTPMTEPRTEEKG